MNIFSFAPKELTNSAIWAWILHSLCEEDNVNEPRRKIAENMLRMMAIPIPNASDVHEIQTEKSMRTLQRPNAFVDSQSGRIDVFMRTQGVSPFVFYIENKVVEQDREVPKLLEQIEMYYRFFDHVRQRDPSYCSTIYPAYFGFEADTGDRLKAHAVKTNSPVADSLICFPAERMLRAFQDTGFEQERVLSDFHKWLTSREAFIRFRGKARQKSNMSIEDVIGASYPLRFGHLLNAFVRGMDRCTIVKRQINRHSVDIRNINFFKGMSTPITLRWYYNSGSNGLYVGLHENFEQILNVRLSKSALPVHFAHEKDVNWLFGYFKTEKEIESFWNGIKPS